MITFQLYLTVIIRRIKYISFLLGVCWWRMTNCFLSVLNNQQVFWLHRTEFRYHLNFIQNHSFSFIPASFSVGLIDLRWRWSVRTFSSVARLGVFSLPGLATFGGRSGSVARLGGFFPTLLSTNKHKHTHAHAQAHAHAHQQCRAIHLTFFWPIHLTYRFILHFCIFSNALHFSFSYHFICFQPFTFS